MSAGRSGYSRSEPSNGRALPPPPRYHVIDPKISLSATVETNAGNKSEPSAEDEGQYFEKQPSWKSWISTVSSWESVQKLRGERVKHWKPVTLGIPLLGGFASISVGLLVSLEILSGISQRDGGLAFGDSSANIPAIYQFYYLYLPTLIAVIYSMFWSWVDLDVKRLEPWFQLSEKTGAKAEDSLLLHYAFDFIAFVPLKAAWRKHWSVFCAGITMMIIFWIITPLQSAVFGTTTITRTVEIHTSVIRTMLPVGDQEKALDNNFLNSAYSSIWLEESLPRFTSSEFALAPFELQNASIAGVSNSTLKGNTLLYQTDLTCWPAKIGPRTKRFDFTFENGKGCLLEGVSIANSGFGKQHFTMLYIGYKGNGYTDYELAGPNCSESAANQFLAIWGSGQINATIDTAPNVTAAFCEASYYKQNVTSQVILPGAQVDPNVLGLGPKVPLTEAEFNISNFQTIIGSGMSSSTNIQQYPDSIVLEQYPRLMEMELIWPVSNMVGFALGLNPVPVDQYASLDTMQTAFKAAHRMLFALAVNKLMVPRNESMQLESGTLSFETTAIVASRTLAIIVEVFLGIVALLSIGIFHISYRRPSNLNRDPASIKIVMHSIEGSQGVLQEVFGQDLLTDAALQETLKGKRFRLQSYETHSGSEMRLEPVIRMQCPLGVSFSTGSMKKEEVNEFYTPVRPLEMTVWVAVIFLGFLFAGSGILVYLWVMEQRLGGLPRPTDNFIVLQILENFLPIGFATLLEPFWVLLNRYLCILRPFDELWAGNAKSSKSLDIKYTSLPPQLTFFRALKARHFLLASVCGVALLSNVLAVVLGAIFNEDSVLIPFSSSFQSTLAPRFSAHRLNNFAKDAPPITYSDHFYVAMTNITSDTKLPPWITPEFYFLPFVEANSTGGSPQPGSFQNQASTYGFGVTVDCTILNNSTSNYTIDLTTEQKGINDITLFAQPKGSNTMCTSFIQSGSPGNDSSVLNLPYPMSPVGSRGYTQGGDDIFCSSQLAVFFIHIGSRISNPINTPTDGRSLEATIMTCEPKFRSAKFDVVTDTAGHVLSYVRTSDFNTNFTSFLGSNATNSTLLAEATQLISPVPSGNYQWQTTNVSHDFITFLTNSLTNGTTSLSPNTPLPSAELLKSATEEVYTRLFAILLGLNPHVFATLPEPLIQPGTQLRHEPKIFMNPITMQIVLALLGLNILVALLFYLYRPQKVLPRMPTTIGSILGYVAASQALRDLGSGGKGSGGGKRKGNGDERRYRFGRFVGLDGRVHVGIERHERVVPILTGRSTHPPDARGRGWDWVRLRGRKEGVAWI